MMLLISSILCGERRNKELAGAIDNSPNPFWFLNFLDNENNEKNKDV